MAMTGTDMGRDIITGRDTTRPIAVTEAAAAVLTGATAAPDGGAMAARTIADACATIAAARQAVLIPR